MKKVTKILIAENVPSLNKGEMTILEGMLQSFRCLGKVEVSMLSPVPDIDRPRYGAKVNIVDIRQCLHISGNLSDYRKAFQIFVSILFVFEHLPFLILYKFLGSRALKFVRSEIWKEYVESDVIIMGHDGAFGTGGGLGAPIYFYPLFMPFFTKKLGKPFVLYGGSIGPSDQLSCRFSSKVTKFVYWVADKVTKFTLNRMSLISLRENTAYHYLADIGVQSSKVFLTADPAFLLQPASFEQVQEVMRRERIAKDSRPLIGMTITREKASKAFPELANPRSSYYKHIKMLAQVIDRLIDRLNATVIFIPHCIGLSEEIDDRIVAADISQLCQHKDAVNVLTNEYSAAELKGLIGQFDFFIGERLHSVVNAMSMGVPSIVISNSADQRLGIIKMFGQEDAICYIEALDADTLMSKISDIWSEDRSSDLRFEAEIMRKRAMLNGRLLKRLLYNTHK
jgi:polysaccharide pyruvyl transferase WcaK-like protein